MFFDMTAIILTNPLTGVLVWSNKTHFNRIHRIHQIGACIFRNDKVACYIEIHEVSIAWHMHICRERNLVHVVVHHCDMLN